MNTLTPVDCSSSTFRGYLAPDRFTLCVGAGISRGISPDWSSLANELVSEAFGAPLSDAVLVELNSMGWSLDGLIQAAANQNFRTGKSSTHFGEMIERCLYANVRAKARGLGLEKYLTTVLNTPKYVARDRVIEVCDFLEDAFPNCSLFSIGKFLVEGAKQGRHPHAILSFNADTFLETYIDLYLRREHYAGPLPHSHPRYYFVAVSGSGGGGRGKIPIYHCHGSIAPLQVMGRKPRDRRDRLVFLEQEYLAMSSSSSAWAQTVFLFHAQTTRMAFCGLSMSDSNIRRWMSAIEVEKQHDREARGYKDAINPEHIWLRPRSSETLTQEILLSSLLHLGIRPAWIESWNKLGESLSNLSALSVRHR
jgi:SIR2-like domain